MTTVIAECGINHQGSLVRALRMVEVAKECGADIVKFQSYDVEKLGYKDEALNVLLRGCRLSYDDHLKLKKRAHDVGIEFMSTAFDTGWVNYLVALGVKRLKISSGKVADRAFVDHCRATGLPLIISNGMCDPEVFRDHTQPRDTILYCVSEYPTPLHKVDFRQMAKLRHSYFNVGFSDHTANPATCVLAAAAGASMVEAHLTLDRGLSGPDHKASLMPHEFRQMVQGVRSVAT